jgi:hypothetical protein
MLDAIVCPEWEYRYFEEAEASAIEAGYPCSPGSP